MAPASGPHVNTETEQSWGHDGLNLAVSGDCSRQRQQQQQEAREVGPVCSTPGSQPPRLRAAAPITTNSTPTAAVVAVDSRNPSSQPYDGHRPDVTLLHDPSSLTCAGISAASLRPHLEYDATAAAAPLRPGSGLVTTTATPAGDTGLASGGSSSAPEDKSQSHEGTRLWRRPHRQHDTGEERQRRRHQKQDQKRDLCGEGRGESQGDWDNPSGDTDAAADSVWDIGRVKDICPACLTPYCLAVDSIPFRTSLRLAYNDDETQTWHIGNHLVLTETLDDSQPGDADGEVTAAAAIELLRVSTRVPLPRIVSAWKEGPKVITLSEQVPGGRTLYDLWWTLGDQERQRLARQVGRYIDQWRRGVTECISSVGGGPVRGHERLFGTGPASSSMASRATGGFGPCHSDADFWMLIEASLRARGVDNGIITLLAERMPESFPCVLTHGDVSTRNIVIDEATGDVALVMGWERAAALPCWAESVAMRFCCCEEDEQWKALLCANTRQYPAALDWWCLWMAVLEDVPPAPRRLANLKARCRRWPKPPAQRREYNDPALQRRVPLLQEANPISPRSRQQYHVGVSQWVVDAMDMDQLYPTAGSEHGRGRSGTSDSLEDMIAFRRRLARSTLPRDKTYLDLLNDHEWAGAYLQSDTDGSVLEDEGVAGDSVRGRCAQSSGEVAVNELRSLSASKELPNGAVEGTTTGETNDAEDSQDSEEAPNSNEYLRIDEVRAKGESSMNEESSDLRNLEDLNSLEIRGNLLEPASPSQNGGRPQSNSWFPSSFQRSSEELKMGVADGANSRNAEEMAGSSLKPSPGDDEIPDTQEREAADAGRERAEDERSVSKENQAPVPVQFKRPPSRIPISVDTAAEAAVSSQTSETRSRIPLPVRSNNTSLTGGVKAGPSRSFARGGQTSLRPLLTKTTSNLEQQSRDTGRLLSASPQSSRAASPAWNGLGERARVLEHVAPRQPGRRVVPYSANPEGRPLSLPLYQMDDDILKQLRDKERPVSVHDPMAGQTAAWQRGDGPSWRGEGSAEKLLSPIPSGREPGAEVRISVNSGPGTRWRPGGLYSNMQAQGAASRRGAIGRRGHGRFLSETYVRRYDGGDDEDGARQLYE